MSKFLIAVSSKHKKLSKGMSNNILLKLLETYKFCEIDVCEEKQIY